MNANRERRKRRFPKSRTCLEVKEMEKELYETPFMKIIEWDKQDIITLSEPFSEGGDDFGGWNDSWFA